MSVPALYIGSSLMGVAPRVSETLAAAQRGLWLLNRLDPASDQYSMPLVLRLPEDIDLGALKPGQGDGIEALRQLRANDPRAVINELRGATGDAAVVGTEAVRGAETTETGTTRSS